MVILRTRNKITDFLMILAWASPFNQVTFGLYLFILTTNVGGHHLSVFSCLFILLV